MASLMATALPLIPQIQSLSCASSSSLASSRSETLGISLCYSTPLSLSATSSSPLPFVYCGRGDKKTERGKRFNHSFGNARPRNKKKGRGPPRIPVPSSPPSKDKFEDVGEIIKIEIDE